MLKELKFAMGAVSKKDFIPALTHFRIENNSVRSYNGTIALCTPIALDLDCTPKAEPLIKAIQHCEDTVSLSITAGGRLSIKSGAFKALIECVEEETPHVQPEGELFDINGEALLSALKVLTPFIGNDASRPWSNGVLLLNQSAFATNNVMLVEHWIETQFPICCTIPRAAVKEMVRINEAPLKAQICENSITFHYAENRWLRSQLLSTAWPDLYKVMADEGKQTPVDQTLFPALEKLKPFVDKLGRVFVKAGVVSTHENSAEGACFELPSFQTESVFNIEMLEKLKGVALTIDFNLYPKACIFKGEKLRGAIIGMLLNAS